MKQDNYFPWWLSIITGAVLIFVGWSLLASPALTVLRIMQLLALYWLIAGIVDIIGLVFDNSRQNIGWRLAGSLLSIIAGIVVLNNAVTSTIFTVTFFTYLIAFIFVFNGISNMVVGRITDGKKTQWSWGGLILGFIYVLFGVMILSAPVIISAASFVWVTGVFAIITGVTAIVSAFILKSSPAQR